MAKCSYDYKLTAVWVPTVGAEESEEWEVLQEQGPDDEDRYAVPEVSTVTSIPSTFHHDQQTIEAPSTGIVSSSPRDSITVYLQEVLGGEDNYQKAYTAVKRVWQQSTALKFSTSAYADLLSSFLTSDQVTKSVPLLKIQILREFERSTRHL